MTPTQADVDRWAKLIVTGYIENCAPPLSPNEVLDLAADLNGPVSECVLLAVPANEWGPDYVNPALDHWEAKMHRRRGRRLDAADYGLGRITMS